MKKTAIIFGACWIATAASASDVQPVRVKIENFYNCGPDNHGMEIIAVDPVDKNDCATGGGTAMPHPCWCNGNERMWYADGDDLGDHNATQSLSMGSYPIIWQTGARVLRIGQANGSMMIEPKDIDPPYIPSVHDGRSCRPVEDLTTGCHFAYCSESCRCAEGSGNCRDDRHCLDGLFCRMNVGANHGCSAITGICLNRSYWCETDCSADHPCRAGQGDCGSENQNCRAGLICRDGTSEVWGCGSGVAICESEFCDMDCNVIKCAAGHGDCLATNSNCIDSQCGNNMGAYYGCPPTVDICE